MDDTELSFALRAYGTTRLLELDRAAAAFCGWDQRTEHGKTQQAMFTSAVDGMLQLSTSDAPVALHSCTHYHGGAGEVLQFTNIGEADERHVVTAARERLPEKVQLLPKGSDLLVTFATGSVSTMALNWVATARAAGVDDILIGALDEEMMTACAENDAPCVLIDGGEVTRALASRKLGNVRADARLYPKLSVLKVGFYRELLTFGWNVWACDADAVLVADPRPMMLKHPWTEADVAVATDCIDVPLDVISPLTHCDFNTGMVYLRSNPIVLKFTETWRETIANAKEYRIRDQAAFNMLTKARPLRRSASRVMTATVGGDKLRLGVLPLSQFLNGHTYFVQHVHTLPDAALPIAVHMTYQFAEGSKFAYGKRQRLREAGLWRVDEPSYYSGRYISVSNAGANLPIQELAPVVSSRQAVEMHLREAKHRSAVLRALLGIGKALGREVILPRMMCYCDFMWKEMRACRVGGAESMRLPFECPMDHVLNTPLWFDHKLGISVREPSFLSSPFVPSNVSKSVARVTLDTWSTPGALDDVQVVRALAPHANAAVIELSFAVDTFCGFRDKATHKLFEAESRRLIEYKRTPFCMEDDVHVPGYSQCCTPRKKGDAFFPCLYGFDPPEPLPACAPDSKP